MSIALEAKVTALETRIAELEFAMHKQALIYGSAFVRPELIECVRRLEELERTAARKPGPKPKDNNG